MKRHQFHLIDSSIWPFISSLGVSNFLISMVFFMQQTKNSGWMLLIAFIFLVVIMLSWWRDVIREGSYLGDHTRVVQVGLRMGFILFMLSELMIFFALFWSFYHYSLSVSVDLGGIWPPINIRPLPYHAIPAFNTLILLWSGFFLTVSHISIRLSHKEVVLIFLAYTIILGFLFLSLQIYEYITAPFNISDGVFGSIFYCLTGLHGMHVLIGVLFLIVCYYRIYNGQFDNKQHLGFDFAVWYWHFVDVVWIFVFIVIYIWGGWIVF